MPAISLDAFAVLDPVWVLEFCQRKGLPTDFWGKANRFSLPRGEYPARGWFLVSRVVLDSMTMEGLHTLTLVDDDLGPFTITNIVFVRADCVTPGLIGDANSIYLLEVSDLRWYLANETFAQPLYKQYNIVAQGCVDTYYQDTLNTGSPWTWQGMLDNLWSQLNNTTIGSSPALPYSPDGTPTNWRFEGVSCWRAYNAVLKRLGCAVGVDADGSFAISHIGSTDDLSTVSAAETALLPVRVLDGDITEGFGAKVPEGVRVFFHKLNTNYGSEKTVNSDAGNQWSLSQEYSVDIANPSPTGHEVSGSKAIIRDDLPAYTDQTGSVTNTSALNTRATERASNYYLGVNNVPASHRIYGGFFNSLLPNSIVTAVSWNWMTNQTVTEVIKRTSHYRVQDDASWQECPSDDEITPWLRAPDLGRSTYPNYPIHVQIVKVTSNDPDGSVADYFPAVVQWRDPTTGVYTDLQDCYYTSLKPGDTPANSGDRKLCRIIGTYKNLPLYCGTAGGSGGSGSLRAIQDTRYCTILYASMDNSTTTMVVQAIALFPNPNFTVQVDDEQMLVTSTGGGTTTWTVTRGVNGTTPAAHADYAPVCQVFPSILTTLGSNVLAGDGTISVVGTTQFPTWGRYYIKIDSEILLVFDGAGTTTWSVLRGQIGTTAAGHSSGTNVYQELPDVVMAPSKLIFDDSDFVQPSTPDDDGVITVTHHEVMQVVRIDSVTPTSKGYYPGFLQKWDAASNTFEDDVAVWVRDIQN